MLRSRALVRGLIPGSIPGNTTEDLIVAKADYTRLDRPSSKIRLKAEQHHCPSAPRRTGRFGEIGGGHLPDAREKSADR
jgi:hypothetical protein